jgi:acetyl-CoA C-acetyltransferase
MSLARGVSLVGAGMTRFHHRIHRDKSGRELFNEATEKAMESVDGGIDRRDLQAVFVGYFTPEAYEHQGHIGAQVADWLGLCPVAGWRTESACASSAYAFLTGVIGIASGLYDVVLVGGVEKMTELSTEQVTDALSMAACDDYELPPGATFPGLYALLAQAYFKKYGATWEQLQAVPIKSHHNGSLNSNAQFQEEILDIGNRWGARRDLSFKDNMEVLKSTLNRMVAYPLRLFDCCPISDGAATAILAADDVAKKYTDAPIQIKGVSATTDNLAIHDRTSLTSLRATVEAGKRAFNMAGLKPKDVDVADVHDCFTIAEILAIEDLGFFKRGEGIRATEEGITSLKGDIPINTDGGLKCKGHPAGATGAGMIHEIWKQLRGEAGKRQISNAEIGLLHNVGGDGASCVVSIFSR